ncbi:MAG: hypoxanthine phosphoribosyltransferase [Bdellovibrionales bacterium]|jgi:hypoxanthine phosphoribosyltransferase|nr:hypoxanthine phosphoribosyltransferase [Bdellovibrionales bacterium]
MSIEVYISEKEIEEKISELGKKISQDYAGEEIVIVCLLSGAFVFCADLVRKINVPVVLEFMKTSSYGSDTQSSGEVKIELDLKKSVEGKNVVIVEDIVDTGTTLKTVMEYFNIRKPKSLKLVSLLHKPARQIYPVDIDYLAFEIEDKFVIGYGLDYAGRYRELPYIGIYNED